MADELDKELDEAQKVLEARAEEKVAQAQESLAEGFNDIVGAITKDKPDLSSQKRREAIEKNLPSLNIDEMILGGQVKQAVKVGENMVMLFRHPSQAEDLYIKRLIGTERITGEAYILDKFATYGVALGLMSITVNGHTKDYSKTYRVTDFGQVEVDEAGFQKKMSEMQSLPHLLISDISVQYMWFEERVWREYLKFFSPAALKNG